MPEEKGTEMVIRITTNDGEVSVQNEKGEDIQEVKSPKDKTKVPAQEKPQKLTKEKYEPCILLFSQESPGCIYFMHGGRWYRVCY